MPVLDPIKLGIVPCRCGRLSNKIHCAACGSYDVRTSVREIERVDPITAIITKYRVSRCRHCGHSFDGYDWQFDCRAPEFESNNLRMSRSLQAKFPHKSLHEISKLVENSGLSMSDVATVARVLPVVTSNTKAFSDLEIAKATSDEGIHQTRIDAAYKGNRKDYLKAYWEIWGRIDKDKGTEPPHELKKKEEE